MHPAGRQGEARTAFREKLVRAVPVVLSIACLAMPPAAAAGELRLLTSMSTSLTDPFIAAFGETNPGSRVLVLNKNTNSSVEEIVRGNPRGFDLFWASAPEAFALIARHGGFAGAEARADCPEVAERGHVPFAMSSIGWSRRADSELFMPGEWNDLLLPLYRGRIGMALPSRSGTSHMLVERFLQVRGWEEGWAFFLQLSENLSTLTSRSFGVIDGVKSGRFDIGLSIDFLADAPEPELDFRYGEPIMLFPAQIGLLAGGRASAEACAFIRFVLSDRGQMLLTDPKVGRIPISPGVRATAVAAVPEPMKSALRRSWQGYDADLAQSRYWAVNALFDLFIAELLPARRELWARLRAIEGRVDRGAWSAIARELARLPVSEIEAGAPGLNASPGRITDLTALPDLQAAARDRWAALAEAQIARLAADLAALEVEAAP